MNISGTGGMAAMAAKAGDTVGLLMLKKAMDASASGMAQLLKVMPPADPGKGGLLDVRL